MDELAFSLTGQNAHYGTPRNPACPGHLPGGSSSGAAAAVAAGDADLGLGGDTAGSVRVPASHCGVFGFRPSHGRVPLEGSCALAPSFDTGGWLARDARVLRRAGSALLDARGRRTPAPLGRWLVGADAFALASPAAAQAIFAPLSTRMASVRAVLGAPREVQVGGDVEGGLLAWADVFRVHQSWEAWQQHGAWVRRRAPALGPGVRERLSAASGVTRAEFEAARRQRAVITAHLEGLLGADAVLAVPSAPGPAPPLGEPPASVDAFRRQLIALSCIASLAGLPQVSLPIATVGGCPVGLGLIGPRGSDEELLELTEHLMAALQQPASQGP